MKQPSLEKQENGRKYLKKIIFLINMLIKKMKNYRMIKKKEKKMKKLNQLELNKKQKEEKLKTKINYYL